MINKSRKLDHVNIFIEDVMKKCIVHVQLTYGPAMHDGDGQNNYHCDIFNHQDKSLIVVYPGC